ncbi:hypothetical protein SprV_0902696700 [Sparganum proliferum]
MRTVKTGAAIYEDNCITAAKANHEARESQLRPNHKANAQPAPTCLHCQRTFREPLGPVGYLLANCSTQTTSAALSSSNSASSSTPTTNIGRTPELSLPSSSSCSTSPFPPSSSSCSSIASNSATVAPVPSSAAHNHDTTTSINPPSPTKNPSDVDSIHTCPHCDRTSTSHASLVGHVRIHRIKTDEPVLGAPTYTRSVSLHCLRCPRIFTHRMGLFSHMRIRESGTDRSLETPGTCTSTMPSATRTPPPNTSTIISSTTLSASCKPTMPSSTHTPSPSASTINIFTTAAISECDTPDLSCPHCPRTFTSHIGLVGHLRIHLTKTGEPVPGSPAYSRRIRLNGSHCIRTFILRMGLLGHIRIHENLR